MRFRRPRSHDDRSPLGSSRSLHPSFPQPSPEDPRPAVASRRCQDRSEPATDRSPLETWLELTGADEIDPDDVDASRPGVAILRDRLLAVLEDPTGQASMPPPTAGDMSQEAWDALTEAERNEYRGRQLRSLDPRLLPHAIRNPHGPFDRPRPANR